MRHYRRDVDGLRSIAVLPVVLFHAGVSWFQGGYVGVDIFFVISGYLISSILIEEKEQGRYSLIGFYERRIRRILPALFFVLIIAFIAAWRIMMPEELKLFGGALVSVVAYVSNMWFWKNTNYFAPAAEENPLLHTWSLSVEEQFYVFFPLALSLFWFLGRRAMFWGFAVAFIASLGLAQVGSSLSPTANFYVLPTRAWELLAGALVAFLHARPNAMANVSVTLRNVLGLSGMALIVGSILFYNGRLPYPSLYTAAPVLGTALLLYAEDNDTTILGRVLSLRPLVGCGLISYSLYLWHQPIFALARLSTVDAPPTWVMALLVVLSLALATFTYFVVEKPFRNRKRFSRRTIFMLAGLFSAGLVAAGWALYAGNGFPARLSKGERDESAVIAAEIQARGKAILTGTCHYSDDVVRDLPAFLNRWSCAPAPTPEGRIFVVGDSHAADVAVALRGADIEIGQITGAGCSIQWSGTSNRCRRMFEQLLKRAQVNPQDTLVLAQRWGRTADPSQMAADLEQWKATGAKVVLIGPRFEYPNFYRKALASVRQGGRSSLEGAHSDLAIGPRRTALIERGAKASGVPIVDIVEIFCSLNSTARCAPVAGDEYLVLDDTHFTVAASERMGPALLARIRAVQTQP